MDGEEKKDTPEANHSFTQYEVASGKTLIEKYGLTEESRPVITLDSEKVPENFRLLIPLAEEWGISDDLIRNDVISKANPSDLQTMVKLVYAYEELLDDWLAGTEAKGPEYSDEYIAFTCLRLAAYEGSSHLKKYQT